MIVCSCNVLSDKDVHGVLAERAEAAVCVKQVYDCLGCAPQCGRCATTIHAMICERDGAGATTEVRAAEQAAA